MNQAAYNGKCDTCGRVTFTTKELPIRCIAPRCSGTVVKIVNETRKPMRFLDSARRERESHLL